MPRLDVTTRATSKMVDDPIVFTLGGAKLSGGEWREEFTAIPVLTQPAMRALGELALKEARNGTASGDDVLGQVEEVAGQLDLMASFLDAVLSETDAERLREAIGAKDNLVEVNDVAKVIAFVSEAISGRPTSGQPSSPDGLSSTASTSPADSSSPATPRVPSLPSTGRTSSPSPSRSTSTVSLVPPTSTPSSSSSKPASPTRRTNSTRKPRSA